LCIHLPVIHSRLQRADEVLVPGELGSDDRKNVPVVLLHDGEHEQSLLLQSGAELEERGLLILQRQAGSGGTEINCGGEEGRRGGGGAERERELNKTGAGASANQTLEKPGGIFKKQNILNVAISESDPEYGGDKRERATERERESV